MIPYVKVSDIATMLPGLQNLAAAQASLNSLASSVSDLATRYTGRTFWIQPYQEFHKGRNQVQITPLQQPVKTITTLNLFSPWANMSLTAVSTDSNGVPLIGVAGYFVSTDNDGISTLYLAGGLQVYDSTTPRIFLSYTAGYASLTGGENGGPDYASLPSDFYQSLLYECATRYKELSRLGAKQEVSGPGQSMIFNVLDLQAQTKTTLNRYKRTWYAMA